MPKWMEPVWLATGLYELGVRETPGPKSTPRIDEYAKATRAGVPPSGDETPWCSSYVNWCLWQHQLVGTRLKAARSWLTWGQAIDVRPGAIAVLSRGPDPMHGHVGLVLHADEKTLWLVGGNQGNAVSVKPYPRARLLGCRWPA